jgi:hypothetical protein
MRCGFCFDEHALFYRVLSWCFSIIKIKAGQLHFIFCVEVCSLYMWDSSFDHVPLQSWAVARLAGMLGNTFTLHSNCKTGDVVWWLGM